MVNANEIDSNSELYIHHGDVSGNFMLATQKLNGDNYNEWRRAAEISLSAKNKKGFVTGSCAKPAADSATYNHWERCNNLVISWILHSVEHEIARSILYYDTAVEIWNELEERYSQSNAPRKFQVHKHIGSLSQGHNSVAAYYTQLKTSWDEYMSMLKLPLCTCGSGAVFLSILQEQQVLQFLMGLNEDFTPIRGNILMMKPLPNLSQAYRLVLQEEQQRACKNSLSLGSDAAALAAPYQRGQNFKSQNIFAGNKPFSVQDGNGQNVVYGVTPSGRRSKFYCDHCKVFGHSIERCFKINGFPNGNSKPWDKGKRAMNCAQIDDDKDSSGMVNGSGTSNGESVQCGESSGSSMITQDQYQQLMALLNQRQIDNGVSHAHAASSSGFLAGAFNEAASGAW